MLPRSPKQSHNLWLWYWLPAVTWLFAVVAFSTQTFGAQNTGETLRGILSLLHLELSEPHFRVLHYLVRKSAHFLAYGTLGAIFFRALRGTDSRRAIWKLRYAVIALAVCAVTASGDEIHQALTPGRTGNWHDVALDLMGAIFFQLLILFLLSTSWGQARWLRGWGGRTHKSISAATIASIADR